MGRFLAIIGSAAVAFCLLTLAASARPVRQDDEAKKAEAAAYKAFYDASTAKDYAKAVPLAKSYLEKFPSGQYSKYFNDWLGSYPILRVQISVAVQEKNKPETLRLLKLILAHKDATEQDRMDYLWFAAADLMQNEIFANPANFAHAAEVTQFDTQLLPMIEAGKKPSTVKPEAWKQNSVVAYIYGALAKIETQNNNTDKALEYHHKVLTAEPTNTTSAFACGKLYYDRYGAAAKVFQAFPEGDQQAAAENKPEAKPEVKAAFDKVNKEADAVIDCWARYLAKSADSPSKQQVQSAVTNLYKYRHNDSTEGLQQLIDKYK